MKYKKKSIFHKIRPDKDHQSLFSRTGYFQNILGKDIEIDRNLTPEEFIEEIEANDCGGMNECVYAGIKAAQQLAEKVLKDAGLPFTNEMHPLPNDPSTYVFITDPRLIGIDPTPIYHAAKVIENAAKLKDFLTIQRDFGNSDLIHVAYLSMQIMHNKGCLILHHWEECARIGEAVIIGNKRRFKKETDNWERIALELFNDSNFMEGKNPSRVQSALARKVAEILNLHARWETIRSHFKKNNIPTKFINNKKQV